MSCLTVERCPAGYPDVAEFLREEKNDHLPVAGKMVILDA